MQIHHVSIGPCHAATERGDVVLSPELLASVGARYSRSNEGLQTIVGRITPDNEQQSIDSIMKFVCYGHASIADMVPLAFFLDGISMYAAYTLFAMSPLGSGQESSTRYIPLDESSLPDASAIGIAPRREKRWRKACLSAFGRYHQAVAELEANQMDGEAPLPVPDANLSPAAQSMWIEKETLKAKRLARNYALDRARNLLPFCTLTNMMMIQSGREWGRVCRTLLSSGEVELENIGRELLSQLEVVAPNCARHGTRAEGFADVADENWARCQVGADALIYQTPDWRQKPDLPSVQLWGGIGQRAIRRAIAQWQTGGRYNAVSEELRQVMVRVEWPRMAIAEVRDLNRHRSAVRFAPLIPESCELVVEVARADFVIESEQMVRECQHMLARGDRSAPYYLPLGATIPFSMLLPLDKFLYLHDLRTGEGAHFRYKQHVQNAYDAFEIELNKLP